MRKLLICFIVGATHVIVAQKDEVVPTTSIIRKDIKLSFTLPDHPLLYEEQSIPVMLRVINEGNTPLPFYIYNTIGIQLKFDFGILEDKLTGKSCVKVINTRPWGTYVSRIAEETVAPGETYDLDLTQQFFPVQEACLITGVTNLTAYLLVGENEWAKSEPFHIRIIPSGSHDPFWRQPPIFTAYKVTDKEKGWKREMGKLFLCTIEGRKWLFNSRRVRVCEVLGDDVPEFQYNEETGIVTISQPTGKQVRYNVVKMKVESDENLQ